MAVVHDTTTSWNLTDDAAFRAWAKGIHDAVTGAGLVQTDDTGQIDFNTVQRPGSADGLGGYAVYRLNDAEQANSPVFVRINYCVGDSTSQGRPQFIVGRGTNGAGTLTDAVSITDNSADANDSSNRVIHAAFSDGAFILVAGADGPMFLLIIEREKDEDGEFNGNLQLVNHGGSTSFSAQRRWNGSWQSATFTINTPGLTATDDGRIPIGTFWCSSAFRPLRSMVLAPASLVASEEHGDLEVDGSERNYIALSNNHASAFSVGSVPTIVGNLTVSTSSLRPLALNE